MISGLSSCLLSVMSLVQEQISGLVLLCHGGIPAGFFEEYLSMNNSLL